MQMRTTNKKIMLLVLLVILLSVEPFVAAAAANQKKGEEDLLFRGKAIPVPLTVNVALLGFNGDGAYRYSLDAGELAHMLATALPKHTPSSLETHKPLQLEYMLHYEVQHLPTVKLKEFNARMANALSQQTRASTSYIIQLESQEWKTYFNSLHGATFNFFGGDFKGGEYTIILINSDKKDIEQEWKHSTSKSGGQLLWNYIYSYDGAYTQAWMAEGRFVVIDLSAGAIPYGPSSLGEGAVSEHSFPQLSKYFETSGDNNQGTKVSKLLDAHISSLVMSAVRYVFASDMRLPVVDADKVLIPLIVLRNHNDFNPWQQDHPYSINLKAIEEEVKKMALPNQEILLFQDMHSLHEHKHLSMAVAKASKVDSVHEMSVVDKYVVKERPYLDSSALLYELMNTEDVVVASYLSEGADHRHENSPTHTSRMKDFLGEQVLPSILQTGGGGGAHSGHAVSAFGPPSDPRPRPQGTRILPVYIFSLVGQDANLVVDKSSLWAASQSAVLVLQTNSTSVKVPYFSRHQRVSIFPNDPTRHIIAGISVALGGINSPTTSYSAIHQKVLESHLWANGHNPFSPYSTTKGLSQILLDAIIRNSVFSRVDVAVATITAALQDVDAFAQKYLYDPFGEKVTTTGPTSSWIDSLHHAPIQGSPLPQLTVDRLHDEVERLEAMLQSIADYVSQYRFEEAYRLSSSITLGATAFAEYVEQELQMARAAMLCCYLRHDPTHTLAPSSSFSFFPFLLLVGCFLLLVGCLQRLFFSSPSSSSRSRQTTGLFTRFRDALSSLSSSSSSSPRSSPPIHSSSLSL